MAKKLGSSPTRANGIETKERILDVAAALFAEKGFDGTSTREISRLAKINIATLNYHFSSKKNLLWEVLEHGHARLMSQMEKVAKEKDRNLEEYSVALYDVLNKNGDWFRSQFKVHLTDFPVPIKKSTKADTGQGVPGEEILWSFLKKELQKDIGEEDRSWAIGTIFSYIVNTAVHSNTRHARLKCKTLFTRPRIHRYIRRLVNVVIKELNGK